MCFALLKIIFNRFGFIVFTYHHIHNSWLFLWGMFVCYGIIISMFFLKILEKLGRKRVVMDRGPSHPEYHLAKPWTDRYYLLFRKRPKWFLFNIFINHIIDNDHGIGLHNHPFPYITIILSGGKSLKI